jgi:hypothetical protein
MHASDDSKISSLVSGLVWVSWSRLLIITNLFVEKTGFTGFWTLVTSSRWSQSPPLCFLVTVAWFFSIRLTCTMLNRSRTQSTFFDKSNKLLFLSTQLRHTLLDKQLSRFNKFLHALVFVDTLTAFGAYLGQLFRFHTWVIRGQRNINSSECFCVFVDPLSARGEIIVWNVHTLFNMSKLKIIRAKIFNAI